MRAAARPDGFPALPGRAAFLGALAVAGLALLLYLPVADFSFLHFDDGYYVTENSIVPFGFTRYGLAQAFALDNETYWHPLVWLSLMADAQFFGLNPAAFHLHNAVLHALSAGILALALGLMTGRTWESLLVAILFAVHPQNVESVAWVAERKSVLSTLFWMLCLWAYAWHARRPSARRMGLVGLFLALGLLAKPTLVVLPAALLLLDWWPLARFPAAPFPGKAEGAQAVPRIQPRRLLAEKLPLLLLVGAATAMVLASRQDVSTGHQTSDPIPLGLRLANIPVSVLKYVYTFLFPQDLAIYYPFPGHIPAWQWGGALALVAGLTVLSLAAARKLPVLAVGWLWFLVCLAPVSGLVQAGLWPERADRFVYLPMVGLCLIAGMGLRGLVPRWGRLGHLVPVGMLAVYFAFFTWAQLPFWQNGQTLFSRAVQLFPESYVAHNNLALARLRDGDVEGARSQLAMSRHLRPDSLWPRIFQAKIMEGEGEWAAASREYQQALLLKPGDPDVVMKLSLAQARLGRVAEAEAGLRGALAKRPEDRGLLAALGKVLLAREAWGEAGIVLERLHRKLPRDLNVRVWLARAWIGQGRLDQAQALVQGVVGDDPWFAPGWRVEEAFFQARGQEPEAARAGAKAREVEAHFARAFTEIGREATAAGKLDSAVYHWLRAVEIAPWSEEYAEGLAGALRSAGRGSEVESILESVNKYGQYAGFGAQGP